MATQSKSLLSRRWCVSGAAKIPVLIVDLQRCRILGAEKALFPSNSSFSSSAGPTCGLLANHGLSPSSRTGRSWSWVGPAAYWLRQKSTGLKNCFLSFSPLALFVFYYLSSEFISLELSSAGQSLYFDNLIENIHRIWTSVEFSGFANLKSFLCVMKNERLV